MLPEEWPATHTQMYVIVAISKNVVIVVNLHILCVKL